MTWTVGMVVYCGAIYILVVCQFIGWVFNCIVDGYLYTGHYEPFTSEDYWEELLIGFILSLGIGVLIFMIVLLYYGTRVTQ